MRLRRLQGGLARMAGEALRRARGDERPVGQRLLGNELLALRPSARPPRSGFRPFQSRPPPRLRPILLRFRDFLLDEQVAILRAAIGPEAFITTNLYPPPMSNAIDIERLTRGMDFASWDNYPVLGRSG